METTPMDEKFIDGNDSCRSPLSPPNKRPCQLRLLRDFNTPDELKMLESVAGEVVELKDYVEWFNSLGVDKDRILWPIYYCKWHKTLGPEAKVVAVLDCTQYIEWYVSKLNEPEEEFPDWPGVIERCAKLALAYFKGINECDDYEYVRDVAIMDSPKSFHLNFYARRKIFESTSEPAPEKLFFAEVDNEDNVVECCILDSEEFAIAALALLLLRLHPASDPASFVSFMILIPPMN